MFWFGFAVGFIVGPVLIYGWLARAVIRDVIQEQKTGRSPYTYV